MRKIFCFGLVYFMMGLAGSYAAEADLSGIITRLERLEKENKELRAKLSKLDEKKQENTISRNLASKSSYAPIIKEHSSNNINPNQMAYKAKSSSWDGFYTQIATGYDYNKVTNTGFMDNNYVPPSSATYFYGADAHSTSMPLRFDVGHYASLSKRYLLGIGIEYSPLSQKTSYPNYFDANVTGKIRFETSARRSIFFSPAYAIDDNNLVYAKMGLSQQEWKIADTHVGNTQLGGVVGLGYKRTVYNGLYGFVELNYYSYAETSKDLINLQTSDVVNFHPGANAYNVMLGIGYKY